MTLHATVDRGLKGTSPVYDSTRHRGQGAQRYDTCIWLYTPSWKGGSKVSHRCMALHATVDRGLKGKSPLYDSTRHRGQGAQRYDTCIWPYTPPWTGGSKVRHLYTALHDTVDRGLKYKSPVYGATRHRGQWAQRYDISIWLYTPPWTGGSKVRHLFTALHDTVDRGLKYTSPVYGATHHRGQGAQRYVTCIRHYTTPWTGGSKVRHLYMALHPTVDRGLKGTSPEYGTTRHR